MQPYYLQCLYHLIIGWLLITVTIQYQYIRGEQAMKMKPDQLVYVGVDLHKQHHTAVIMD